MIIMSGKSANLLTATYASMNSSRLSMGKSSSIKRSTSQPPGMCLFYWDKALQGKLN